METMIEEQNEKLLAACKCALGFVQMFKDLYIPSDKEEQEFKSYSETLQRVLVDAIGQN